jgi:hypothetical protein
MIYGTLRDAHAINIVRDLTKVGVEWYYEWMGTAVRTKMGRIMAKLAKYEKECRR